MGIIDIKNTSLKVEYKDRPGTEYDLVKIRLARNGSKDPTLVCIITK